MTTLQNTNAEPEPVELVPGEPELDSRFDELATVNDLRGRPDSSRTRRRRHRIDTPGLLKSADSSTREAFALRRNRRGKRRTAAPTSLNQVVLAAQQAQSKLGRWARGATGLWVLGVACVLALGFLTWGLLYLTGVGS